ncbi:uncharacterized protein LOC107463621 [Arachis duranensis]|uniref:Uncharacterized protein LOC107463621 n=1 Tax=Arachis duranensis TaxID=130453 RepID=A0A6P4BHW7_ARADU|nr:uncharacterized protein LOC107463621 [Arachis duranensis]XP_057727693.1 uncharacterized protein LOC130943708 [Arachis stenosperma]
MKSTNPEPEKSSSPSSSSKAETLDSVKEKEESTTTAQNGGSLLKDSSDAEVTKITLMRAFVESKDPASKDVDDLTLRRFLRARDLDVEKASYMFLKYLKWKLSFVPNGVSPSEIPEELAHRKLFSQGFDKQGRPIVLAFAAKHYQGSDGGDGFKRFVAFTIDKLCSRMPAGQEKFCAIADIKGWGYANSDIRGYLNALTILQDYNPERMGKLFILHAPYVFMKVWQIIYPFIDNNTKKKIVFVDNKKITRTLLEEIDESQLPEIYGGKLPLVPIENC